MKKNKKRCLQTNSTLKNFKKTKCKFCCLRFVQSVKEKIFIHSNGLDETEWFMPKGYHIYYCPFCGSYIRGKGFGKPTKQIKGTLLFNGNIQMK